MSEWELMWMKYTVFHVWTPRVEYAPVDGGGPRTETERQEPPK